MSDTQTQCIFTGQHILRAWDTPDIYVSNPKLPGESRAPDGALQKRGPGGAPEIGPVPVKKAGPCIYERGPVCSEVGRGLNFRPRLRVRCGVGREIFAPPRPESNTTSGQELVDVLFRKNSAQRTRILRFNSHSWNKEDSSVN